METTQDSVQTDGLRNTERPATVTGQGSIPDMQTPACLKSLLPGFFVDCLNPYVLLKRRYRVPTNDAPRPTVTPLWKPEPLQFFVSNTAVWKCSQVLSLSVILNRTGLNVRYGLVARIPGFHPGGSGSIPGTGIFFMLVQIIYFTIQVNWGNELS